MVHIYSNNSTESSHLGVSVNTNSDFRVMSRKQMWMNHTWITIQVNKQVWMLFSAISCCCWVNSPDLDNAEHLYHDRGGPTSSLSAVIRAVTEYNIYLNVSQQEATMLLGNNSYFLLYWLQCCLVVYFLSRLQHKGVDKIAALTLEPCSNYICKTHNGQFSVRRD